MKSVRTVLCLVVLSLSVASTPLISASNGGPSSNGDFNFTLEDGADRFVKFHARVNPDGSTKGEMTYTDPTGTPDSEESIGFNSPSGLLVKANLDCLVVNGNQAVMSGAVTESNNTEYIGNRVLLVVEDNDEGVKAPNRDKLAWGLYRLSNRTWIPTDAELAFDDGALLDWLATDAEREDDTGIPARKSEAIGCQSFSLSSYSFEAIKHGAGNIQVKP